MVPDQEASMTGANRLRLVVRNPGGIQPSNERCADADTWQPVPLS